MADATDELGPVDYVVVEFSPGQENFTGEMAQELGKLIESGTIRLLDLLIVSKDDDGAFEAFEVDDLDEVDELRTMETEIAEILAAEDVAHLAAALEPGATAGVVVYENSWAAPVRFGGPPLGRPARRVRAHPHPGDPRLVRSRASRRGSSEQVHGPNEGELTCPSDPHESPVAA